MFSVGLVLKYLPTVIVAMAFAGGVWWVMDLRRDNVALKARVERLTLLLAGCDARVNNIQKDKESDAEIDNMLDLRRVPDTWLLPPTPGTGGIY